ncbi:hypothetical protein D3C71_707210 [compost metagenome]
MCGMVAKKTRISSEREIRRMKNIIEPDKTGRFCRPCSFAGSHFSGEFTTKQLIDIYQQVT